VLKAKIRQFILWDDPRNDPIQNFISTEKNVRKKLFIILIV
jgi:hypothetical protein